MLTEVTREKLLTFLKSSETISMHVSSTRNMDAMLNNFPEVIDGELVIKVPKDYIPWYQDEPVVLEVLKALDAIERGDYEEVDFE